MLKKLLVLTAILALALVASPAMAGIHEDTATVSLTIDNYCAVTVDAGPFTLSDTGGDLNPAAVPVGYSVDTNHATTITHSIVALGITSAGPPATVPFDDGATWTITPPASSSIGPGTAIAGSASVDVAGLTHEEGTGPFATTVTITCTTP